MEDKRIRVSFHNLGCKVNGYETEAMAGRLAELGYEIVPFEEPADVCVINTCTVTNIADRKSRQMLHRARALNPEALIVAAGCYAQAAGEELLRDEAVDLIIGNDRKSYLPRILEESLQKRQKSALITDIAHSSDFEEMTVGRPEHTRAYLKIEDGCNQFCSYCLIPYVRGRVRSLSPEAAVKKAERLAETGCREIVLTGIHVSSYGLDLSGDAGLRENYGRPLLELLRQLERIPALERIRLSSLEPRIMSERFTEELAGVQKLCPHFHLSLQSGCDSVLRRMNRKYTAAQYRESLKRLRRVFDRPALTTDVIVGFPGETEEEFEETVRFLTEIELYETHIFRYSRRRGTVADRMPGQVPEPVKAARSQVLAALNETNRRRYEAQFLGEMREILPETVRMAPEGPVWTGHTREYLKLRALLPQAQEGVPVMVPVTPETLCARKGEES